MIKLYYNEFIRLYKNHLNTIISFFYYLKWVKAIIVVENNHKKSIDNRCLNN
jgi:hypothetical protein